MPPTRRSGSVRAFKGWGATPYVHGFGPHGAVLASAPFHQHWLRLEGDAGEFGDYAAAVGMARAGRFAHPGGEAEYGYGLTLDPVAYAAGLRGYALSLGVVAARGPGQPAIDVASGRVIALTLPDHTRIEADLYVDIQGALADLLAPAREDWSRWLPSDAPRARRTALPRASRRLPKP